MGNFGGRRGGEHAVQRPRYQNNQVRILARQFVGETVRKNGVWHSPYNGVRLAVTSRANKSLVIDRGTKAAWGFRRPMSNI